MWARGAAPFRPFYQGHGGCGDAYSFELELGWVQGESDLREYRVKGGLVLTPEPYQVA
jgi:hypothetical protein